MDLIKFFGILTFWLSACIVEAQSQSIKHFNLEIGLQYTTLKTERTQLYRPMYFPGASLTYLFNSSLGIKGSCLFDDLHSIRNDIDKLNKYSEVPYSTHSYEEVLNYIGKSIGIPDFRDYIFIGLYARLFQKGIYTLGSSLEAGHRDAYYITILTAIRNPSRPNGYELFLSGRNASSYGLKIGIDQQIELIKNLYMNITAGTYWFGKSPNWQPWLGINAGIRF